MRQTTRMSHNTLRSPQATRGRLARLSAALLLAPLALAGCLGARGDVDLLEAKLRQQQDLSSRYSRDLIAAQKELNVARQEADVLRRQLADAGAQPLPAEFTDSLFRVQGIQFNGLMTGGRDRDGRPGDDVVVAVLAPQDEHGDLVKLPGAIELEAIDLTKPEGERSVARWTFTAAESRQMWKSGLFSAGYQFELPWTAGDTGGELHLHAKLSTADGRTFDATQPIKIVAAGGAARPRTLATPSQIRPVSTGRAAVSMDSAAAADENVEARRVRSAGFEEALNMTDSRRPRPAPRPLLQTDAEAEATVIQPADDAFSPPPGKPAQPVSGTGTGNPREFPDGLKTSDVWTDATIPTVR